MTATLEFLGAAGTVTGSKLLLTVNERRVLVDCGLYQGLKELRRRNWDALPVDPRSIEHVVLTHAHIDHSGCRGCAATASTAPCTRPGGPPIW